MSPTFRTVQNITCFFANAFTTSFLKIRRRNSYFNTRDATHKSGSDHSARIYMRTIG
eukprot:m.1676384 g.1676384  ORF g.1676384 m.1676384 type:complete len:57 (+) comp189360_c0_seq1:54-224(+)